jgi:hypothetical protein
MSFRVKKHGLWTYEICTVACTVAGLMSFRVKKHGLWTYEFSCKKALTQNL